MITAKLLKQIAPNAKQAILDDLEKYFDKYLEKYGVNTHLRICHFLAQAAHESAGFKTLEEYASGAAYEGRKDLGNTKAGDGVKYKGRGIFQLTGKANYAIYGEKLGVDLVSNPKLAATAEISVQVALEYWNSKKLSVLADQGNIDRITKLINGGFNGLEDRKANLKRALSIIPKDIKLSTVISPVAEKVVEPDPLNPIIFKKGDKGPDIAAAQQKLVDRGYKITADGSFGPKTVGALLEFQTESGLVATGHIDALTSVKLFS